MGRAIGIDLGTTNTAVAVLKGSRPEVLEDDKGYKVLPSFVSSKGAGKFLVGQAAKNLVLTHPQHTVYAVKRLIGRRFDSPQAIEARKRMAYRIEPAPDGMCLVGMGDQSYSPVEISSMILKVARKIAERALNDEVTDAVITVPAYFNHSQRAATFEAARLAGLKCERLVNEPTAAALAYGFKKTFNRTIVVYDLGGGTFDVTVLRLEDGIYEVLATAGDTYLGGEDFDHRLVAWLAEHFEKQHGFDPREDSLTLQRMKDAAERAKCELSFTEQTMVMVPRITATDNLEVVVTRSTLESLLDDMISRTLQVVERTITDARVSLASVDDVLLVGGQTRMPIIRKKITDMFGKEPSRTVHPDEVVALGAAVHAEALTDPTNTEAPLLMDVTPFALGIDVAGGMFDPVIPKHAQVPTSQTKSFATHKDNQELIRVTVRQGDSRTATENEFLGEFVMRGLTPAPRMETKVDISFRIDSSGMLHVAAVEKNTGEKKQITVRNYAEVAGGDGEAEIMASVGTELSEEGRDGPVVDAPAADESKKKGGFLGGLFGRLSRKKKEVAPAKAEPAEQAEDVAEDAPPERPEARPESRPTVSMPVEGDDGFEADEDDDYGPAAAAVPPSPASNPGFAFGRGGETGFDEEEDAGFAMGEDPDEESFALGEDPDDFDMADPYGDDGFAPAVGQRGDAGYDISSDVPSGHDSFDADSAFDMADPYEAEPYPPAAPGRGAGGPARGGGSDAYAGADFGQEDDGFGQEDDGFVPAEGYDIGDAYSQQGGAADDGFGFSSDFASGDHESAPDDAFGLDDENDLFEGQDPSKTFVASSGDVADNPFASLLQDVYGDADGKRRGPSAPAEPEEDEEEDPDGADPFAFDDDF